jgi:hypothetical protein
MNVIFLDIDGVLNRHEYIGPSQSATFNRQCVNNFNKLLLICPNVVLVSAWRYIILRGDMTLNGFALMMRTHGIYYKLNLLGNTRQDSKISVSDRCFQIKDWIGNQDINYVVLDDMDSFYWDTKVKERLVTINGNLGLTAKDVKKAIKILGE